MEVSFSGVVTFENVGRYSGKDSLDSVLIRGRDVISELVDYEGYFHLGATVKLEDKTYQGVLSLVYGDCSDEWKPQEFDALSVGDHDLLKSLREHEREKVNLSFANKEDENE